MRQFAPIVMFVYNRPLHTEQTLISLMSNKLANESTLYIYADGVKPTASNTDRENISKVRKIIRARQWCKEVNIIESQVNLGLADSIIGGVNQVINKHGRAVVLEDDIITAEGFLQFMNDALDLYEHVTEVMHISGYMYPHKKYLPDTFYYNVPLCWGWATWKRAWQFLETDSRKLYNYFDQNNAWDVFNKFGDKWLQNQLKKNLDGEIKTWFIKWHASIMMQKGYCLFPGKSLVNNIGFDGSGVHNDKSDRFTHRDLAKYISVRKSILQESKDVELAFKLFYKNLMNSNIQSNTNIKNLKRIFPLQKVLKKFIYKIICWAYPELYLLKHKQLNKSSLISNNEDLILGKNTKLYQPFEIYDSIIGDYTYVSRNSFISKTVIGKFCSIGPNIMCGRGFHPLNGISTSPMFYSNQKQNGVSFCEYPKADERKWIIIGNDVLIGANVTVLDGVTIGDGAVVGAGSIVSKDIPPYAIAFGNPIEVKRFRFTEIQIEKLLKIKWWNFDSEKLKEVEKYYFDIEYFIKKYDV